MIAIGAEDIRTHLKMADCIEAMEDLYRNGSGEMALQPMRTLNRINDDSLILTMPSYSQILKRFGVKIISEYKSNAEKFSLPVQGGVIVLFDAENAKPLAILNAPILTAIRTGAVSGLATKLLSRKDSNSVAVVGSGQQARALLEGVYEVRTISKVRVFSRNYAHAKSFAKEMTKDLGISVVPHEERREATKNADIIILATNSTTPVIEWKEIFSGCHINSVGTLPDRREIDLETVCNSRLYVDTRQGVLNEAGDVMHAVKSGTIQESHLIGDLSDLLSGKCEGRQNENQVTLFKSVGQGLQDVYASDRLYRMLADDARLANTMTIRSPA